jgi:hypothetical protein
MLFKKFIPSIILLMFYIIIIDTITIIIKRFEIFEANLIYFVSQYFVILN